MRSSLAQRGFPQKKCLRAPRSSQERRIRSFTVPAPVIKVAEQFCIRRLPCISYALNSSKEDWKPGKRRAIRSSHTTSLSSSTSLPSSGPTLRQRVVGLPFQDSGTPITGIARPNAVFLYLSRTDNQKVCNHLFAQ